MRGLNCAFADAFIMTKSFLRWMESTTGISTKWSYEKDLEVLYFENDILSTSKMSMECDQDIQLKCI